MLFSLSFDFTVAKYASHFRSANAAHLLACGSLQSNTSAKTAKFLDGLI